MAAAPEDLMRILTHKRPWGRRTRRNCSGVLAASSSSSTTVRTAAMERRSAMTGLRRRAERLRKDRLPGRYVLRGRLEGHTDQVGRTRTTRLSASGSDTATVGPLFAENLAHVWQVLLTHAASAALVSSAHLRNTDEARLIASYLSFNAEPAHLEPGLLPRVVGRTLSRYSGELESRPHGRGDVRIPPNGRGHLRGLIGRSSTWSRKQARLYVVVDNLEDLHVHVETLRTTLSALFRATRDFADVWRRCRSGSGSLPVELVRRLRDLTANPEKDFLNYLVIRWTAAELMTIAVTACGVIWTCTTTTNCDSSDCPGSTTSVTRRWPKPP